MAIATIDLAAMKGWEKALREGRPILLRYLAAAYREIAAYDIATLKASLSGKLNIRSRGLSGSFKGRGTDSDRATDFNKLFATEYTGWKAAEIFQTGGTIRAAGGGLTVLTGLDKNGIGRRAITQAQLKEMIAAKQVRFVPIPRGVLIVQDIGGLTKTGKNRLNSRSVILGVMKKQVTEKKRLDFFENAEANDSVHGQILESAIAKALQEMASTKG